MKIITISLPESWLNAIDALTGDKGIYPSRSEMIRVAVREFLIETLGSNELKILEELKSQIYQHRSPTINNFPEYDDPLYVKIPLDAQNGEPNFKLYKIIKK